MATGKLTIGSYAFYPLTSHGELVIGSYAPYPLTSHGKLTVGFYGVNPPTIKGVLVIGQLNVPNPKNQYLQTNYLVEADTDGTVKMVNIGKDDDGIPIYFELETHEIEFGNRAHTKQISDQIQVLSKYADSSTLQAREDDRDYKNIPVDLTKRISINDDVNLKGKYFGFKWFGEVSQQSPILEGISIEKITDVGLNE